MQTPRDWSSWRWTLPAVAVGGMVGSLARHALEVAWPVVAGGFPWATFVTNVAGCGLLGVLMVLVVESRGGHPLLRPFAGVGVLGGFTTFSTYTVQTAMTGETDPALALAYLFGTLVVALTATTAGLALGRRLWLREPA